MKTYWFAGLIITLFLVVGASAWPTAQRDLTTNQTGQADKNGYAHGAVNFSNIVVQVQIPTTTATQEMGLAGRSSLTDQQGMLWLFTASERPSFWMRGMKMALDFIWLKNNQVVQIHSQVPPPQKDDNLQIYRPDELVDAVLEVAGGFTSRNQVNVGDIVRVDRF